MNSRKRGKSRVEIVRAVWKCPTGDRFRANEYVVAEKKTGHTKAYRHLNFWLSDGDEGHLLKYYENYLAETRKRNQEKVSITRNVSTTEFEKALHGYINLIVQLYLPVSVIESNTIQNFSKRNS